jgi:NADH:ubiquinone oxidoreductase subunit K
MSIELILNAANLNFIAFSRYLLRRQRQRARRADIRVFVIVVAAAEARLVGNRDRALPEQGNDLGR